MLLFGNDREVNIGKFPDGTMLIKMRPELAFGFWPLAFPTGISRATITWLYENDAELVALIHVTKHLRRNGITNICLKMPYIPNARQDRVKGEEDVFTLKSFAEVINWLDFTSVEVLNPHSSVSEARNKNQLLKAKDKTVELGLIEGEQFGLIYDNCLTELTPEEDNGTTLTEIWFCPLPDDIAHIISKKISAISLKYTQYSC